MRPMALIAGMARSHSADPFIGDFHRLGPACFIFVPYRSGQSIEYAPEVVDYLTRHFVALLDFVIEVWILRNDLPCNLQLCIEGTT